MVEGILPVAEMFESIQGEGQWVGTPMLFIRLAGCNVGKPAKALKMDPFPILYTGLEAMACVTYDGRIFPCDTDYSLKEKVPIKDVVQRLIQTKLQHVCVTGGEPFLHPYQLQTLWVELERLGVMMHVETSGTLKPKIFEFPDVGFWITCAPKLSALSEMIEWADELKLLVDQDFDIYRLTPEMRAHPNVFLCPVNSVEIDQGQNIPNVRKCLELLKAHPNWRLSVQLHKFFGLR